jgi:hypothetical protein
MNTRRHFIALLAAAVAPLAAQAQTAFHHRYAAWDALLKKHALTRASRPPSSP